MGKINLNWFYDEIWTSNIEYYDIQNAAERTICSAHIGKFCLPPYEFFFSHCKFKLRRVKLSDMGCFVDENTQKIKAKLL